MFRIIIKGSTNKTAVGLWSDKDLGRFPYQIAHITVRSQSLHMSPQQCLWQQLSIPCIYKCFQILCIWSGGNVFGRTSNFSVNSPVAPFESKGSVFFRGFALFSGPLTAWVFPQNTRQFPGTLHTSFTTRATCFLSASLNPLKAYHFHFMISNCIFWEMKQKFAFTFSFDKSCSSEIHTENLK